MQENIFIFAGDITLALGPWGYQTGEQWSFETNPGQGIKQIIVKCGLIIDSIAFKDTDGRSTKFGGNGGYKTFMVSIDFPREYLTGISGTHGSTWLFPDSVTSLTFITNKTQHGPFGTIWGTEFSVNANGIVVTGFHGHCGKYVEGIGLYIKACDESDNGFFSAVRWKEYVDFAFRFVGSLKARIKAIIDEGLSKIISKNLEF